MLSDDELDTLTSPTLPLYRQTPQLLTGPAEPKRAPSGPRLANVWDSREDLFAVGEDDDEVDHRDARLPASKNTSPRSTPVP
jgi:hypothetical protein